MVLLQAVRFTKQAIDEQAQRLNTIYKPKAFQIREIRYYLFVLHNPCLGNGRLPASQWLLL